MAQDPNNVKESLSNAGEVFLERLTTKLSKSISQGRGFRRLMEAIGPDLAPLVGELGPYAGSIVISLLPDTMLGSGTTAALIKSGLVDLITKLGDVVKNGGTAEERTAAATQALPDAANQAFGKLLVMDPYGYLHEQDCPELQRIQLAMPKPQQRQQRGQPPVPPASPLPTVTLEKACERGLRAAPCCFNGIEGTLKKSSEKPKADKNRFASRSPLEVLGQMTKGERQRFDAWLSAVPPEERPRLINALRELDSREEFIGLMSLPPEIRAEALPLLENRNFLTPVKQFLRTVGTKVLAGGRWTLEKLSEAWQTVKAWDEEHFKDLADEAQERFKTRNATDDMVVETEELDRWPTRFWRGLTGFLGLLNPLR